MLMSRPGMSAKASASVRASPVVTPGSRRSTTSRRSRLCCASVWPTASVAVALARLGRGDAYAAFGRRARGVPRETDLATAERDYLAGTAVLEGLLQKKAIEGTDVKTLEAAREELARIRADRAGAR